MVKDLSIGSRSNQSGQDPTYHVNIRSTQPLLSVKQAKILSNWSKLDQSKQTLVKHVKPQSNGQTLVKWVNSQMGQTLIQWVRPQSNRSNQAKQLTTQSNKSNQVKWVQPRPTGLAVAGSGCCRARLVQPCYRRAAQPTRPVHDLPISSSSSSSIIVEKPPIKP